LKSVAVTTPAPSKAIYDRIWSAIAEHKLRPGTRLKEEQLSEIFGVSRARVRAALAALERDGLVTLVQNRGAFVAQPTIEEARDVLFVSATPTPPAIADLIGHSSRACCAEVLALERDGKMGVQLDGSRALGFPGWR
jgi:DNA-binding GntR family transcriptional regulator